MTKISRLLHIIKSFDERKHSFTLLCIQYERSLEIKSRYASNNTFYLNCDSI